MSPAFASSIAFLTSSTSSPRNRACATRVVLFFAPDFLPPFPFSKGRPRTRGPYEGHPPASLRASSIAQATVRLSTRLRVWSCRWRGMSLTRSMETILYGTRPCSVTSIKPRGNKLPDCRRDRMPVDAVALKIVVGYRQPTVVHPAMVCKFNFKPVQYSPRRQTQFSKRWRLEHVDFSGRN
jgi:hypothetical protein